VPGTDRQPAPVGSSEAVLAISCTTRMKSSRPGAGTMIVSRRPFTSSVIRRNLPRAFSRNVNRKSFRSMRMRSDFSVVSGTCDSLPPPGARRPRPCWRLFAPIVGTFFVRLGLEYLTDSVSLSMVVYACSSLTLRHCLRQGSGQRLGH